MSTRRRIGILSTLLLLAAAGVPAIAQTSLTLRTYDSFTHNISPGLTGALEQGR